MSPYADARGKSLGRGPVSLKSWLLSFCLCRIYDIASQNADYRAVLLWERAQQRRLGSAPLPPSWSLTIVLPSPVTLLCPVAAKTKNLIHVNYFVFREFVLRSVHITHPSYLEYCRGLLGAMVCIKPPQGAQVGAGGGGPMEQVREARRRNEFNQGIYCCIYPGLRVSDEKCSLLSLHGSKTGLFKSVLF